MMVSYYHTFIWFGLSLVKRFKVLRGLQVKWLEKVWFLIVMKLWFIIVLCDLYYINQKMLRVFEFFIVIA